MSKKDTSLERIDLVKLLLFILIFIIVCFIMIFGFIIPNIKEYRGLARENRSAMSLHAKAKQIYDEKNSALEALKDEHKFIIKSYDTKFDKQNFIAFASTFFSDVKLSEADSQPSGEYFLYELGVTSSVKTPQKFYDFLEGLTKFENIIKAEFPIQMKGDADKIRTIFNIRVYGLK